MHFAPPCPLILLFVTCTARNSSCPTLYLFFVALIETKTTCSYSQTMVGQGLCCVSLATQLLTRTVFFTLFSRLRSPCKLCLPSHTLTTVSMKRRRCVYLLLIIPTEKVWNPQYRQILFVPKWQKQFWSVYWTRKKLLIADQNVETDNCIAKTFSGICKYKFTE